MFQKLLLQSCFLSFYYYFPSKKKKKPFIKPTAPLNHFLQPFFFFHSGKKNVLGRIFFFFSLMNGLESSNWMGNYLFLDSSHCSKSKRENTPGLGKNFPLDIFHWFVAQLLSIKSSKVYWLDSCALVISLLSSALLGLIRATPRLSFKNHSWSQELRLLVPLYIFLFVPVY